MLDSSVCIPILRGRASFRGLPAPQSISLSATVAAELWAGVYRLGIDHSQFSFLSEFFEIFEVLDFSKEAARHYGEIRVDLERRGAMIGPLDLLIAAHARSIDATLLTGNVNEFRRVKGLKTLAWK